MRESRSVRQHGEDGDDLPETPALRQLRRLVTLLMGVLILGTITVSAALVIRLGGLGIVGGGGDGGAPAEDTALEAAPGATRQGAEPGAGAPAPGVPLPPLALPEGHAVTGLGRGAGELLVITRDPSGAETLRAFDAATGAPRSTAPVRRVPAGARNGGAPGNAPVNEPGNAPGASLSEAGPEPGFAAPPGISGGSDDAPGR